MYSRNLREALPRDLQQKIDAAVPPEARKRDRWINGTISILKIIPRGFAKWFRHRAELHKLQGLTDRDLKDIGFGRNEATSSIERLIEFETRPKFNRLR